MSDELEFAIKMGMLTLGVFSLFILIGLLINL